LTLTGGGEGLGSFRTEVGQASPKFSRLDSRDLHTLRDSAQPLFRACVIGQEHLKEDGPIAAPVSTDVETDSHHIWRKLARHRPPHEQRLGLLYDSARDIHNTASAFTKS